MDYSKAFLSNSNSLCTHNSSLEGATRLKFSQGDATHQYLLKLHTLLSTHKYNDYKSVKAQKLNLHRHSTNSCTQLNTTQYESRLLPTGRRHDALKEVSSQFLDAVQPVECAGHGGVIQAWLPLQRSLALRPEAGVVDSQE